MLMQFVLTIKHNFTLGIYNHSIMQSSIQEKSAIAEK